MQLFLELSAAELISAGVGHTNEEMVNGAAEIKVYMLPPHSSCVLRGTVFSCAALCSARNYRSAQSPFV